MRNESRAFGPGSRRAVFVLGAVLAVVLAGTLLDGALSGSAARGGVRPDRAGLEGASGLGRAQSGLERVPAGLGPVPAKYGGLPSWLPKTTVRTNDIVQASEAHPALEIQGDTVAVTLPGAHVDVTTVGPEVPEEGRFPVPATTPCTFVVTFAGASRAIPVDPAAFTLIDDLGHTHHPRLTAMDGGPAPREIAPGGPVSLKLHDVLPTGDGGLSWTPEGSRPIVAWDYTVEID